VRGRDDPDVPDKRAADKCTADLGIMWAGNACIGAVEDGTNQAIVKSMADEACARAKLSFSDPAVATAACEEAHAKTEKAAWVEIERGAKEGRQPNLLTLVTEERGSLAPRRPSPGRAGGACAQERAVRRDLTG
jgi:hypothetical protein